MGTTPESDLRGELAALTRDLRARLAWHQRGGAWAAPGGKSPRYVASTAAEAPASRNRGDTSMDPAPVATSPVAPPAPATVHAAAVIAPGALSLGLDGPASPSAARSLKVIRDELGDCRRCKL